MFAHYWFSPGPPLYPQNLHLFSPGYIFSPEAFAPNEDGTPEDKISTDGMPWKLADRMDWVSRTENLISSHGLDGFLLMEGIIGVVVKEKL